MNDLRQALDRVKHNYQLGYLTPGVGINLVVEAASRWADLLDQEPIRFCQTHRAGNFDDTSTGCRVGFDLWCESEGTKDPGCRMVRVRLAPEEDQP